MNLKGLRIVWVGMLVSLIGGCLNGSGGGNALDTLTSTATATVETTQTNALSTVGGIISFVAFILIIVGLSKMTDVSEYFKKARNLLIATFVVAIVSVIVIAVFVAGIILSGNQGPSMLLVLAVSLIVLIILLLVFSILYYKNFLKGCRYTARRFGEAKLADKFRKMWRTFVVSISLIAAGAIVLICGIIGLGVTTTAGLSGTIQNTEDVTDILLLAGILPGVILMVVGAIMLLVFTILLLVRVGILAFVDHEELPPEGGVAQPVQPAQNTAAAQPEQSAQNQDGADQNNV